MITVNITVSMNNHVWLNQLRMEHKYNLQQSGPQKPIPLLELSSVPVIAATVNRFVNYQHHLSKLLGSYNVNSSSF